MHRIELSESPSLMAKGVNFPSLYRSIPPRDVPIHRLPSRSPVTERTRSFDHPRRCIEDGDDPVLPTVKPSAPCPDPDVSTLVFLNGPDDRVGQTFGRAVTLDSAIFQPADASAMSPDPQAPIPRFV